MGLFDDELQPGALEIHKEGALSDGSQTLRMRQADKGTWEAIVKPKGKNGKYSSLVLIEGK